MEYEVILRDDDQIEVMTIDTSGGGREGGMWFDDVSGAAEVIR